MPDIPWYFGTWYSDFGVLSGSRTQGTSAYNPIDIPSIIQYAQAVGIESYELPMFIRVIQYLDSVFLLHHSKKSAKSGSRPDTTPRSRAKNG